MSTTILYFVIGMLVGLSILVSLARFIWHSKYYPGVTVANVALTGLTQEQARSLLMAKVAEYRLQLAYNGGAWSLPSEHVQANVDDSLKEAYRYGRRLHIPDYLLLLIGHETNYPLLFSASTIPNITTWIEQEITPNIEIQAREPLVEVVGKKIVVTNGSDGQALDHEQLERLMRASFSNLTLEPITIPTKPVNRALSPEALSGLKQRAEELLSRSLVLTFEDTSTTLTAKELVSFLSTGAETSFVNESKVREYLSLVAEGFNREPQNAKFVFEGGTVKEFAPGKDGVKIEIEASTLTMSAALEKLITSDSTKETVSLTATLTPPQVTTDKVNDLGIRERIGRGESYYAHSIPNRIFNVGLAASRTHSALIPPGEEYSFNREVGEISGATGYKTAYVISGGRTVLGDGGGVCQVSTTLFRAAMNAGLPIVERWAHAYRVGYYEQNSKPGVDATVYSPSKDFRFKNDTPGYILIQVSNDPKKLHLTVEIYGTHDGRVATVSEPKVWGITPPPPDIYQDDPNLPVGTLKQVDWSAPGTKTSFEYKVVRNGETIQEKIFTSSYRPWQNVYLRGTAQ